MRTLLIASTALALGACAGDTAGDSAGDTSALGAGSSHQAQVGRTSGAIFDLREELAKTPPIAADYGPYQARVGRLTSRALTAIATSVGSDPILPPGIGGTALNLLLTVESTGKPELFGVYIPDSDPSIPRPLLTAFHGFATSHRDIDFRTTFYQEAAARDWFLVAPLQRNIADPNGAHFDINYASAQSQLHVEAVIGYVLENYNVDLDRLYGVGFSMGGGSATSYAARNRDRSRGAFAAVVNHTGTVALADEYKAQQPGGFVGPIMEQIFGGTPVSSVFEWQRSSTVILDDLGAIVPGAPHMGLNLANVPLLSVFNAQDQLVHLQNQTTQLHDYVTQLQGSTTELLVEPGGNANCPGQHCWGTLDATYACDWLAAYTLDDAPTSGSLLADRSAQWGQLGVVQVEEDRFTSLDYDFSVAANRIFLFNVDNCRELSLDVQELGFDPAQPINILVPTGLPDAFVLELTGLPQRPSSVTRLSSPLLESCQPTAGVNSWCFNDPESLLRIYEFPSGPVDWRVFP